MYINLLLRSSWIVKQCGFVWAKDEFFKKQIYRLTLPFLYHLTVAMWMPLYERYRETIEPAFSILCAIPHVA